MRSLLFTALLTALLTLILACGNSPATGSGGGGTAASGSPTEAYKQLYAAVKSKNTEQIKAMMSKKSQAFAEMIAARQGTSIEKVYENGFTASTFAESLPEIRDERINGNYGAVEVYNSKDKRWEDLGFIVEDGAWKFAVGDMFDGSFQSPGKGRDQKEKEAANAMNGNNMIPVTPTNGNANNTNIRVITPKERPEPGMKPGANKP